MRFKRLMSVSVSLAMALASVPTQAIAEAAHDANVQLRQVEERQQAPDHPILWGVPETHYLDFFIFQVV